jgi:hypothetical protein
MPPEFVVARSGRMRRESIDNNGCGDPSYTLPQIIEAAKTVHFTRAFPCERGQSRGVEVLRKPVSRPRNAITLKHVAVQLDPEARSLLLAAKTVTPPDNAPVQIPPVTAAAPLTNVRRLVSFIGCR